jgi:hypothetical protein
MIMDFLGKHVSQCEQASKAGDPSLWCCVNGTLRKECDDPSSPDFRRWGFALAENFPPTGQDTSAHLSWAQVKKEIDEGRPFAFVLKRFDAQVAHMYVAIGYKENLGPETLICLDPQTFTWPKQVTISFSTYSGSVIIANLGGTSIKEYLHQADYFDIHWDPVAASNQ